MGLHCTLDYHSLTDKRKNKRLFAETNRKRQPFTTVNRRLSTNSTSGPKNSFANKNDLKDLSLIENGSIVFRNIYICKAQSRVEETYVLYLVV